MERIPRSIVIPDEFVKAAKMSEAELLQELAIMLFQQEKISLAKAAQLVGMHRLDFQKLLASREIPIHYGLEELEEDVTTLRELVPYQRHVMRKPTQYPCHAEERSI